MQMRLLNQRCSSTFNAEWLLQTAAHSNCPTYRATHYATHYATHRTGNAVCATVQNQATP